jgi:hypothetical protein
MNMKIFKTENLIFSIYSDLNEIYSNKQMYTITWNDI